MEKGNEKKENGIIISMVSGKGGAGKTSASLSIASLLSQMGLSILLIDFDLATNGASFFLKRHLTGRNKKGIWDLMSFAQNMSKNSDEMEIEVNLSLDIDKSIINVSKGFDFLASRVTFDARPLDTRAIDSLVEVNVLSTIISLKQLRAKYNYIIIDCQAGYSTPADIALEYADKAIFVSELDPISNDASEMLLAQAGRNLPEFRRFLLNKLTVDEMDQYEKVAPLFRALNRLPALPHDFKVRNSLGMNEIPVDLESPSSYLFALINVMKEILPEEKERIERTEQNKIKSLFGEYEREINSLSDERALLVHKLDVLAEREAISRRRLVNYVGIGIGFSLAITAMCLWYLVGLVSIPFTLGIFAFLLILSTTLYNVWSRRTVLDSRLRLDYQRELENINNTMGSYQSLIYSRSKSFGLKYPANKDAIVQEEINGVYYRCKKCGQDHKSPIEFSSKQSFESSALSNNAFECPETNTMASYDKKDMYWKADR